MRREFKSGIAMIELIFALVIMGIVLLPSPMLIQQSIKSSCRSTAGVHYLKWLHIQQFY